MQVSELNTVIDTAVATGNPLAGHVWIDPSVADGPALNWLVAKALGTEPVFFDDWFRGNAQIRRPNISQSRIDQHLALNAWGGKWLIVVDDGSDGSETGFPVAHPVPNYLGDANLSIPILQDAGVCLHPATEGGIDLAGQWVGILNKMTERGGYMRYCATRGHGMVQAGLRCFALSRLGSEVGIPAALAVASI